MLRIVFRVGSLPSPKGQWVIEPMAERRDPTAIVTTGNSYINANANFGAIHTLTPTVAGNIPTCNLPLWPRRNYRSAPRCKITLAHQTSEPYGVSFTSANHLSTHSYAHPRNGWDDCRALFGLGPVSNLQFCPCSLIQVSFSF